MYSQDAQQSALREQRGEVGRWLAQTNRRRLISKSLAYRNLPCAKTSFTPCPQQHTRRRPMCADITTRSRKQSNDLLKSLPNACYHLSAHQLPDLQKPGIVCCHSFPVSVRIGYLTPPLLSLAVVATSHVSVHWHQSFLQKQARLQARRPPTPPHRGEYTPEI